MMEQFGGREEIVYLMREAQFRLFLLDSGANKW